MCFLNELHFWEFAMDKDVVSYLTDYSILCHIARLVNKGFTLLLSCTKNTEFYQLRFQNAAHPGGIFPMPLPHCGQKDLNSRLKNAAYYDMMQFRKSFFLLEG